MATLRFLNRIQKCDILTSPLFVIGQLPRLQHLDWNVLSNKLLPYVTEECYKQAVSRLSVTSAEIISLHMDRASLGTLPTKCSRHNTPSQAHALTKLVSNFASKFNHNLLIACDRQDVIASGCAVSRAYSLFNMKANSQQNYNVDVEFLVSDGGDITDDELLALNSLSSSIQRTCRLVDSPANLMNTTSFAQEAQSVGEQLGVEVRVILGDDLRDQGFGGIYGVGKAGIYPPHLVVLSHKPAGARHNIAWVGKGIMYDTGGLSLKSKTAMVGMKKDMAGAAGILGAFEAAVRTGFAHNLHAVLCIAENAIGPSATRPDDIHTMYSGKTVEINNTDAEGRLVLADGVYYAKKDLGCDVILDMATLTSSQGTATGAHHAALLTNTHDMEAACMHAGKVSGDLVFPVVYSPELHFSEFNSVMADCKNCSTNLHNANSSCAGLFIGYHIGFDFPGIWIHVDMAYPAERGERATGYGVALLPILFGQFSASKCLAGLAPSIQVTPVN